MASLSQVRTRIRQRSNNEHTSGNFVTDAELNSLINVSYKDLYGTLVDHSLHRTEDTLEITADGSTEYALPTDMYALLNVYRVDDGARIRLGRHSDRLKPGDSDTGDATSYRVKGGDIVFYPTPASGTYEVDYIPVPGDLVSDADTLDGVLAWEEYIVCDVAAKVLTKESMLDEASVCFQERDRMLRRIEDQATRAEFNETRVVENVNSQSTYLEGDWTRRGYRGPLR